MSTKQRDQYSEIVKLLHEAVEMGRDLEKNKDKYKDIAFAGDPIQMHFDAQIREILGLPEGPGMIVEG